jgi:hypothetical protein
MITHSFCFLLGLQFLNDANPAQTLQVILLRILRFAGFARFEGFILNLMYMRVYARKALLVGNSPANPAYPAASGGRS